MSIGEEVVEDVPEVAVIEPSVIRINGTIPTEEVVGVDVTVVAVIEPSAIRILRKHP